MKSLNGLRQPLGPAPDLPEHSLQRAEANPRQSDRMGSSDSEEDAGRDWTRAVQTNGAEGLGAHVTDCGSKAGAPQSYRHSTLTTS
jgi:hypothetical protein